MANTSIFIKRMRDYKKCMKFLKCVNYIYLDEIKNFEFKKISKYTKSKYLYDKVKGDFELINELIDKQDLLNAATLLRTLYENIIYIITTSYDKKFIVKIDTPPGDFRKVLENNCNTIFTDYFDKEDFNDIYKYLCKLVHPSSLKEILSYMNKTIKYKNYLLGNLRYIMLSIEYMYLNFLNKKVKNEESKFDLNLIDASTYVNLVNVSYFAVDVKDSKSFIKRYFYYDTDNKYVVDNKNQVNELYDTLITKKDLIEKDVKELTKALDLQINESKYKADVDRLLKEK